LDYDIPVARQEKRRHEVPVEESLIRDERARQEHGSNGCDRGLCYYSRPKRLPVPMNHRRYGLQSSPWLSVKSVMVGAPQLTPWHTIAITPNLFLEEKRASTEPGFGLPFLQLMCSTSQDVPRPSNQKELRI